MPRLGSSLIKESIQKRRISIQNLNTDSSPYHRPFCLAERLLVEASSGLLAGLSKLANLVLNPMEFMKFMVCIFHYEKIMDHLGISFDSHFRTKSYLVRTFRSVSDGLVLRFLL